MPALQCLFAASSIWLLIINYHKMKNSKVASWLASTWCTCIAAVQQDKSPCYSYTGMCMCVWRTCPVISNYHTDVQKCTYFIRNNYLKHTHRNRGTTFQMTEKSDSGDMAVLPPCHTAIRVLRSSSTSSLVSQQQKYFKSANQYHNKLFHS